MKKQQIIPYSSEFDMEMEEVKQTNDVEEGMDDFMVDVEEGTNPSTSSDVLSTKLSELINLFTLDIIKDVDREGYTNSDFLLVVKVYYVRYV